MIKFFNKHSSNDKNIKGEIIYKNNHVINIYGACTCCYDNLKPLSYLDKKSYIEKRVDAGHESILEHGRLAMKFYNIHDASLIAQITTYEYSKYLEFFSIQKESDDYVLIINGNMRSYKHFMTNTLASDYENNIIVRLVHNLLINNTVKELYGKQFKMYDEIPKFVEIEYFNDETKFNGNYNADSFMQYDTMITDKIVDVPTTNLEPIKTVDIGIDTSYINSLVTDPDISTDIYLSIMTVGILFKNMSRTATHQLVRHRNAITQESQRYVNAKDATFTIPLPNYDNTKKYSINLFDQEQKVTLSELASELMNIYPQLMQQGLRKEEARAYLPSNVNCGKLYMTFSLSNLQTFLNLRTDKHAQYEIRQYATVIKESISQYLYPLDNN